jgi:hypothetical protein
MPIQTSLWKVCASPQPLCVSKLASEKDLEDMIVAAPELLNADWMLIDRQENTGFGGIIDLLAIAPDSSLVLIEIKRDRTPREVVAQALDYAVWVETLDASQIASIYSRFSKGGNLVEDFRKKFGQDLDIEALNEDHNIVIVAGSLDSSSERIVSYLNKRGIGINVMCFQVFSHGEEQFISRSWLLDTAHEQTVVRSKDDGANEPWNGEFYSSFGHSEERLWEEAVQYGFICGGGGAWYSRTLKQLKIGDRVWVNIPKTGYVGVGKVTGLAVPAREFVVNTPDGDQPFMTVAKAKYHRQAIDSDTDCEYFVPIQWDKTVDIGQAVQEIGLFGNQNTVCSPTATKWRRTVDRLKIRFGITN